MKIYRLFCFSIFLYDLTEFISHAYEGLNRISNMAHLLLSYDDIEVCFKLYVLLYGYDIVIFAENEHELQAALNAMFLYCKSWDLKVNPSKTKITIFSNKNLHNAPSFKYNGHNFRSMIVLYTWELYFPAFSKKIARNCLIKLARLCIRFCTSLKYYVCLLTFNYNFLTAWWLQFYFMDQNLLASMYTFPRQRPSLLSLRMSSRGST